jgi:hypothetical protein
MFAAYLIMLPGGIEAALIVGGDLVVYLAFPISALTLFCAPARPQPAARRLTALRDSARSESPETLEERFACPTLA